MANLDHLSEPVCAAVRAERLIACMQNDAVDFIWIVRGGEGSADIIPYLHQQCDVINACKPKSMMGLSDATAILIYLQQQYAWPTTYGIGASALAKLDQFDEGSMALVRQFIVGECDRIELNDLKPLNKLAMGATSISAPLCVGNMSLLAISIKDLWEFDAANKILIIEDWNERGYIVDRTLKYFKRIGQLEGVKALIFGDFVAWPFSQDQVEQERQLIYLHKVFNRFAESCEFPVLTTQCVGHGRYQTPMPMYVQASLQCGINPVLHIV